MRRISRRKERIKKILDILEKRRATFENLLKEIKCGRVTLSNDLKILVKQKVAKKTEDPKDSRVKWYEKVVVGPDDRVKAEKGKYASIDFIESLENPIYAFETSKDGKKAISAFIAPVEEPFRVLAQKMVNNIVRGYKPIFSVYGKGIRPGWRIAVVLTSEG